MHPEVAVAALAMAAVVLALMGLTATGERRRGHGFARSVAAGLFFPVTWVIWYLLDKRRNHPLHGV